MSENNITPSMRKHGTVTGFATYSDILLLSMKNDVGLDMPLSALRSIRDYYRSKLRRDITLDELYMLDRLLSARELTRAPLNELFTDSDAIAASYADLQSKAAATRPKGAESTLDSMSAVTRDYLHRVGKKTSFGDSALICIGDLCASELMMRGFSVTTRLKNAALGIRGRTERYKAPAGSLLVLVYPWGRITPTEFGDALESVMLSQAGAYVLDGSQLDDEGIIGWLTQRNSGAYVDTTTLSPIADQIDGGAGELTRPELMVHSLDGAVLAVLPASGVNEFMRQAYEKRLWSSIVGSLTSDSKLSVNYGPVTISYPIEFLKAPAPITPRSASLSDSTAHATEQKSGADNAAPIDTAVEVAREFPYIMAAYSSDIEGSAYQISHDNVLCAIADCIAGGADFTDVCLTFRTEVTEAANSLSTALSSLIGAYRAQIEYCIPDMNSKSTLTSDKSNFTVVAAAKLPESESEPTNQTCNRHSNKKKLPVSVRTHTNIPAVTQKTGSAIYLLEPATLPDGGVDYEDLRHMWQYVTHLAATGIVISARAVSANGVGHTINAMLPSGKRLCVADGTEDATLGNHVPGAIIVETNAAVEGIFLGRTADD